MRLLPHAVAAHGPRGPDSYEPVALRFFKKDSRVEQQYSNADRERAIRAYFNPYRPEHYLEMDPSHESRQKHDESVVIAPEFFQVSLQRVDFRDKQKKPCYCRDHKRHEKRAPQLRQMPVNFARPIPVRRHHIRQLRIEIEARGQRAPEND